MPLDPEILDRMAGADWHSYLPPVCPQCGYNLTGAVSDRCPECGAPFRMRELRQNALDMKYELKRAQMINDWVCLGFGVAVVAMLAAVAGTFAQKSGGIGGTVCRMLGVLCALPGACLGLTVLHIYRLPPWLREELKPRPRVGFAIAAVLLSVTVVVWSLMTW